MKKQVDILKSLNLSNITDEIKQIEIIFPQNQINDLICNKLKEIKQLEDNSNLDNLEYTSKRARNYSFSECSLPVVFLRDIGKKISSPKDTDKEQSKLVNKLKDGCE